MPFDAPSTNTSHEGFEPSISVPVPPDFGASTFGGSTFVVSFGGSTLGATPTFGGVAVASGFGGCALGGSTFGGCALGGSAFGDSAAATGPLSGVAFSRVT